MRTGRGYWSATCRRRAAVRWSPGTPATWWAWRPMSVRRLCRTANNATATPVNLPKHMGGTGCRAIAKATRRGQTGSRVGAIRGAADSEENIDPAGPARVTPCTKWSIFCATWASPAFEVQRPRTPPENADMHLRILTMAALLTGLVCFAGCDGSAGATEGQDFSEIPWPTRSWQGLTPQWQSMGSASLARLIESVGTYKQDSLMIVRHGRIVAEAYYAPYVAGISHDLRSATKSVVSTLTAIELQHGLLDSVDHPVVDLFPDKTISNIDDNKKAMTVQSLLDMTSGIDWKEKAYTPDETIMRMYASPDRTEFVLSQPMSNAPGSQ